MVLTEEQGSVFPQTWEVSHSALPSRTSLFQDLHNGDAKGLGHTVGTAAAKCLFLKHHSALVCVY